MIQLTPVELARLKKRLIEKIEMTTMLIIENNDINWTYAAVLKAVAEQFYIHWKKHGIPIAYAS